jgi:SSS family solute:Na+ symporter
VLKFLPSWTGGAFPVLPFLDRMEITFLIILAVMVLMSLLQPRKPGDTHKIVVEKSMFKVDTGFIIASIIICGVLAALYTVFW